jgi:CubicO group peptidase (beta-lactamase class C family)
MKISLRILILFLLLVSCNEEDSIYSKPEMQGVSSQRLERIDDYVQRIIGENKIPGAVALVRRNGKIIYNKAFGFASVENKIKYQTNHIFRIASMTMLMKMAKLQVFLTSIKKTV